MERVAPARPQLEKPVRSNKHPVQPKKINRIALNDVHVSFGGGHDSTHHRNLILDMTSHLFARASLVEVSLQVHLTPNGRELYMSPDVSNPLRYSCLENPHG